MRIASFDIGKRNFAFVIEEYDDKIKYQIPLVKYRQIKDQTRTPEYENALQQVYHNGKIICFKNIDIVGEQNKKINDESFFRHFTNILNEYAQEWDACHVFLIEQQMGYGKNVNLTAIKIAQHCYSYFILRYLTDSKQVIEFPSYHKTRVLGAPKNYTKPQRKKWSIKEALGILLERESETMITEWNTYKKKDDISDCLIQLQAYKILQNENH